MSNHLGQHGSAKIYQFPVGGRASLGARTSGEGRMSADHSPMPSMETVCSGSWYHQAAIDEAKPA